MLTKDFDYELPEELIAQEPLDDRSASRLLVLERSTGKIRHRCFRSILEYLQPGDILVVNDTRVSAFRMYGTKTTGAAVEALFTERLSETVFQALMKPGRRLKAGDRVRFSGTLEGVIVERLEDGSRAVELFAAGPLEEELEEAAQTPLPPYIRKPLPAGDRYQTVYSRHEGSWAAPTAGLHFTDDLLDEVRKLGVSIVTVTLHISASTFRPVRADDLEDHTLEGEWVSVSPEAADAVNSARGRVWAVGTTSTRVLEAAAEGPRRVRPMSEKTALFIKPGHQFKVVEGLITNFHMPRSTLLVLVSAFAGREKVLRAYSEAVRERYRFLSLGDAMLIY